ncbi:5'-nucleotidase isoform X2 [Pituophis catenifer annectens]|uniref:5'-nucleotidase isoform X2 n=1 Tax=Pituophis catenifer annectens TaxID=94852 RepID=UPI00399136B9
MQTPRRGRGAQGCPRSAPSPMRRRRRLLVGAVWFCAALSVAAGSFELTILHTNDAHARVEQTSRDSGKCTGQDCYGGVARRATKIREIRATHRNVLLLDAGDQYQGTIWFSYFKGREVVRFMNSLRYDAMALGNHEFDNGLDGLLDPLLKHVNFPILSANIKPKGPVASNISGYILPYKIINVGTEKVGIIGYTTKETPVLSNPGPYLEFRDEVEELQKHANKLITLGVNKIIALGHSGFKEDRRIAQKVKGIDVVIGGHTNTFLYTGSPPSNEVAAGNYPFMEVSDDGRQVPVVQAYAFGKYLGYLNLEFDDKGNVINASGNPILLNKDIPEDPAVKAEISKMKVQLQNYSSQEIGKTIVYLNGTTHACRFHECNLGNLICDAVVYNNLRHPDDNEWNHVSMCILNGGGIRSPIDEQANNGIKVVYDLSRKTGSRVISLNVLCTECRVPTYVPLEMEKSYKVLLSSFLATGGDGYYMLKGDSSNHSSGDLDISIVGDYIKRMGKVFPAVEGRLMFSAGTLFQEHLFLTWGLCISLLYFIL